MSEMKNLFVDSNEKEVATLGGNYLSNFLSTGSLENGFCVVSDKRVYFKGKCYYKSGKVYKASKDERTVDLKDITGTGFTISNMLPMVYQVCLIIAAIALVVLGILWLAEYCFRPRGFRFDLGAVLFCALCIILAIVAVGVVVLSYIRKVKLFEISFAGGIIAFKASNYKETEMQVFQKELRKAKDNYSVAPQPVVSGSNADELKKYKELLDAGAITQEEYDNAKKRILG